MIVVTGISGVGKTYTILRLVGIQPSFVYARASQILADLGRPIHGLSDDDVAQNQIALRSAVAAMADDFGDRLLIDGHAVIETTQGVTVAGSQIYNDLPIAGVVTIIDDPAAIGRRRVLKSRSSNELSVTTLQEKELIASKDWARSIGRPHVIVKSGDVSALHFEILNLSR